MKGYNEKILHCHSLVGKHCKNRFLASNFGDKKPHKSYILKDYHSTIQNIVFLSKVGSPYNPFVSSILGRDDYLKEYLFVDRLSDLILVKTLLRKA
jgi:hypothetical protein